MSMLSETFSRIKAWLGAGNRHPGDGNLSDGEFAYAAQSYAATFAQAFGALMFVHQKSFEGRAAEHDRAPIIAGALDAMLRFSITNDPADDVELRRVIINLIDDAIPQIRFDLEAQKVHTVGGGNA